MSELLLEMHRITKRFPGVTALDGVSLSAYAGEVLCLVGENGAGKSTLMKILSGVYQPDEGEIKLGGTAASIDSPRAALQLGVSTVYQEHKLIPNLSVAENIFFGRLPRLKSAPFLVDYKELRRITKEVLDALGIDLNPSRIVATLSSSQSQMVEIAKAYSVGAKITILDEPSAAITEAELLSLFEVMRRLKQQGRTFIYISHRLHEIFEIGDRVTVLKDGRLVGTKAVDEVTTRQLIGMMVGREVGMVFPPKDRRAGAELLRVENLSNDTVKDCSIVVRSGEIVALAGLVGSGRSELAESIFGRRAITSGSISLEGKPIQIRAPRDAIQHGIGFITEDRKSTGLILNKSVSINISLAVLKKLSRLGFVQSKAEREMVERKVDELGVKTPSIEQEVQYLSGGNQQKVVLSKWLVTDSKLLICDEPTKGIDVGTKQEFYQLLDGLARQGMGILLISSELPEVIGLADRVYVLREGRVVKELPGQNLTEEKVARYAMGGETR
ncbi:MAG: sugar ABC transporter ATP-binding protein [Bacillota bacterium]